MRKDRIRFRAASRRGSRTINQDNLRVGTGCSFMEPDRELTLRGTLDVSGVQVFCVCDGAGGEAAGEKASVRALYGIREYLDGTDETDLEKLALGAAHAAQERVLELFRQLRSFGGSTLAMALIRGREFVTLNIGDSPVFLYCRKEKNLQELSLRHNTAWEKLRRGIEPKPGDYSEVTCCLGQHDLNIDAAACVTVGCLEPGDALLLCSDGVSEAFTEKQLKTCLRWRISAASMARHAARQKDSDNCTAIRLDV